MISCSISNWRTSSYSSTDGGTDCVETGWTDSAVGYRDSKEPEGRVLLFPTHTARTFIRRLQEAAAHS